MKQFTLNLDSKQLKPVIKLGTMDILLDTGADFPVWAADKQILIKEMGAKLIKREQEFGTFAGKSKGDVYRLDYFVLGQLIYCGLDVLVCDNYRNSAFYMILSATMFRGLIYQIDTKNHKLNIDIPANESEVRNLVIKDSNGKLHVLCNGMSETQLNEARSKALEILFSLKGVCSEELRNFIKRQYNIDILNSWLKYAKEAKSINEFEEKIGFR